MINHQFRKDWKHYALKFDQKMLAKLDCYSAPLERVKAPTFYRFEAKLNDIADTFIDCFKYGKGCILVNGFNLGR